MGMFILVLAAVAASASGYSTYPGYPETGYYGMEQSQEKMGLLDFLNPIRVLNHLIKSLRIFFGGLIPQPVKLALQKLTEFFAGRPSNEQYPPRQYPGFTYPAPKNNYYPSGQQGYPSYRVSGYSPNPLVGQTNGAVTPKRLI